MIISIENLIDVSMLREIQIDSLVWCLNEFHELIWTNFIYARAYVQGQSPGLVICHWKIIYNLNEVHDGFIRELKHDRVPKSSIAKLHTVVIKGLNHSVLLFLPIHIVLIWQPVLQTIVASN